MTIRDRLRAGGGAAPRPRSTFHARRCPRSRTSWSAHRAVVGRSRSVSQENAPATSTAAPADGVPSRRDPVRLAARLSPLLGLAISATLVVWGLQTGVLQSLENLQAFIGSLGAWGPVVFLLASTASVVFPIVPQVSW